MATSPFAVSPGVASLDPPIPVGAVATRSAESRSEVPGRVEVLSEELFTDALLREQKRTYRTDWRFAVVVLEWRGTSPSWAPVLRATAAVKRQPDVAGWLEQGAVLGLLLRETSPNGAAVATERLRRHIAREIGDASLARLSIGVYVHDRQQASGSRFPPVDGLLEAFVPRPRLRGREIVKRVFDIACSLALLALFALPFVAVFAAVKGTSPGPALFRQTRIGKKGERFSMLKFRSMYVNSGHAIHEDYAKWFITSSGRQTRAENEVFKLTNDPRITRVGCFLRKTSLDELPQFWNVLRGEMSLVGPRPPLPFEVEHYQPWHLRRVLDTKPGVTGPWQVHGRSRTTFDEMVRLDLQYARTHSLWTDIRILAATPLAMLSGKGAC